MEQASADKDSERPAEQVDNGQFFSKIRTESANRIQKEKIRTKTRQGQDMDSAVRRRLLEPKILLAEVLVFGFRYDTQEVESKEDGP